MSKKRPTESSWDSDEELLSDTSGITAFPKSSELDLLGDDGELDEDALLGMDEAGTKTVSVSFANDSMRPLTTRQRSKGAVSQQESVDEQAFVFEETDTADLEDELNVGGQDDAYHEEHDGYSAGMYDPEGAGGGSQEHTGYGGDGILGEDASEMAYVEQTDFGGDNAGVYDSTTDAGYMGDGNHGEGTGVELGYEQPLEQDQQVHLEYGNSQRDMSQGEHASEEQKDSGHYESESDSDDDSSRHGRGKFTNERTGVISLAAANARETIPDTLEINEEQAAQIEQFMTDKTQRGKGKSRGQGRPSAHSRLGMKGGSGAQQNMGLLQGPRMGPFPRMMPGHPPRMGFPFPGGPQNRGPFPGGMMNPRGPFPVRLMNQRGPFPGGRVPFLGDPNGPRGMFSPGGPSGPQRGPFPPNQMGRLPGNVRGSFLRGPLGQGPLRMPQRSPQGPRPQSGMNQRGPNPAQFEQQPRQMGPSMPGPHGSGPKPLMGPGGPRMRQPGPANHSPGLTPSGQPIPSLVKMGPGPQNALMSQQPRIRQPNSAQSNAGRIPPHQRLGPMQRPARPQQPGAQLQGSPRLLVRAPGMGPGAPPPLMGDDRMVRKHKIYINPKFQGQQGTAADATGVTRTVKMGVPVQQKKAKALLERAIQTKNKPGAAPTQVVSAAAVKRKSTGGDEPPVKVTKTQKPPNDEHSRVVEASDASELNRMNALLEEQKRKRELIQKRKELARQKQAEAKRIELEKRLKEEGKTIKDILGKTEEEKKMEEEKQTSPKKEIRGSVAARLGPPPAQQVIRGPPPQQQQPMNQASLRMSLAVPQRPPDPRRPQQNQGIPQHIQNVQSRPLAPRAQISSHPGLRMRGPAPANEQRFIVQSATTGVRIAGAQPGGQQFRTSLPSNMVFQSPGADLRFRAPNAGPRLTGPSLAMDARFRSPPPTTGMKLQAPPSSADPRLRGPVPTNDPRLRGPVPTSDPRLRGPPPNAQLRLRAPFPTDQFSSHPPASDPRLRGPPPQNLRYTGPPPQAAPQSPQVQHVRYTAPVPTTQIVRYQQPHSAPPNVVAPQYPPQYPPSSAPVVGQTPQHYTHTAPSQPAPISPSVPQYTPQTASYQPPAYPPPSQSQPHMAAQHPPSATPPYIQTAVPQYQTPPQHYSAPSTPQYPSPSAHQYGTTSQYQTPTSQYQTPPTQQYTVTTQSYEVSSGQHYNQQYDYYSEPQPIQTITRQQVSNPSPAQDQRTVQHHAPVGQRIQTIGQRVQPVTGTQMRSIIHNVVSPKPSPTAINPGRMVQTRTPGSSGNRVGADGQVSVLDGPQKILIQNVPQMATKETLIKICRHFGQVLGVNLMREQNKAVVQFQKGEQAAKCVAKCNHSAPCNSSLKQEVI